MSDVPPWYLELDREPSPYCAHWGWNVRRGHYVYRQEKCGYCWAITVAEVISWRYHIRYRNQASDVPTMFSPQELLDGVFPWLERCYGLPLWEAFMWVQIHGLRSVHDYPVYGQKELIKPKNADEFAQAIPAKTFGVATINFMDEEAIINHLREGPLACSIYVTKELLNYKEGIYTEGNFIFENDHLCPHALVLWAYGYDTKKEMSYFVVKNSWGREWGHEGFGRIACPSNFESSCLNKGHPPYLLYDICFPYWDFTGGPQYPHQQFMPPAEKLEKNFQNTFMVGSTHEQVEHTKVEPALQEVERGAELKRAKAEIEELKAEIEELQAEIMAYKETENENRAKLERAKSEIEELKENEVGIELKENEVGIELKKLKNENEVLKAGLGRREKALVEAAQASEREAVMKVGHFEEADTSNRKAGRVLEQSEAVQGTNAEMEAELRRLKVQSEQWRKAAEAGAAMISSPFLENFDDKSPKNWNMLRKLRFFGKKGQK